MRLFRSPSLSRVANIAAGPRPQRPAQGAEQQQQQQLCRDSAACAPRCPDTTSWPGRSPWPVWPTSCFCDSSGRDSKTPRRRRRRRLPARRRRPHRRIHSLRGRRTEPSGRVSRNEPLRPRAGAERSTTSGSSAVHSAAAWLRRRPRVRKSQRGPGCNSQRAPKGSVGKNRTASARAPRQRRRCTSMFRRHGRK
eukprot:SAG22_NODE_39_length_26283_cov_18.486653_10_plen_194_part_00